MKRAAEKLNSRRGASILLALVFVLTCVMVGISILSAAASNAGRTHSNHEEQQLYLSLSSALQLVADDLSNASYTPNVKDLCREDSEPVEVGKDEEGNVITETYTTYTHTFSRAEGSIEGCLLKNLFQKKLDAVFDTYMSGRNFPSSSLGYDTFVYINNISPAETVAPFTLTVTPDMAGLPIEAGRDPYHAAQAVEVDVDIDDNYRITLTAHLPDSDAEADSFRLSTVLTRSSSTLPDISLPTYGTDGTTTIPASPAVTWKQGVIESAYVAGGGAP